MRTNRPVYLLLALLVGGCAALPMRAPDGDAADGPVSNQRAVVALADSATQAEQAGELGRAAVNLERALRIEPRNASLWHRLAQLRFAQGDYGQVVQLASKSNSLTGRDDPLRQRNWALIADAYERQGEFDRARAARTRLAK